MQKYKCVPYRRHYKLGLVYFLTLLFTAVCIVERLVLQTGYELKEGKSAMFWPKIRSLLCIKSGFKNLEELICFGVKSSII
jgi:hypothetical protein